MKQKILNSLLILTSLIGYIEWGGNHHGFLFQLEGDVILKLIYTPSEAIHPLIILPLLGQILLFVSLFQKEPKVWLNTLAIICILLLIVFITFIGALSLNYKIFISGIPFIWCAIVALKYYFKNNNS